MPSNEELKITISTVSKDKGVKETKKALKGVTKETKTLTKESDKLIHNQKEHAKAATVSGKALDRLKKSLDKTKKSTKALQKETSKTKKSLTDLAKAGSKIQLPGLSGVGSALGSIAGAAGPAAAAMAALAIGLTAAAKAATYAVTQFVTFDDKMRKVGAVSGATGEQFKQMTGLAKELGRETKFTAEESADAMQFLSMAGFNATKTMEALPGVLDLAAAGATDLGTAADVTTNILTGYGLEARHIGQVNDVLVKTFTSSNTSLTELGYAFSYVGPLAKAANIAFTETAAVLGKLGDAGYKGERGGTAFRGALAKLLDPTDEAREVLKKYSLTLDKFNAGKFVDTLKDIEKAGLTAQDSLKLFGKIAGPGILALVGRGADGIARLKDEIDAAGGISRKTARDMEKGLGGALRQLSSAWDGLILTVGEGGNAANNAIRDLAKELTQPAAIQSAKDLASVLGLVFKASVQVGNAVVKLSKAYFALGNAYAFIIKNNPAALAYRWATGMSEVEGKVDDTTDKVSELVEEVDEFNKKLNEAKDNQALDDIGLKSEKAKKLLKKLTEEMNALETAMSNLRSNKAFDETGKQSAKATKKMFKFEVALQDIKSEIKEIDPSFKFKEIAKDIDSAVKPVSTLEDELKSVDDSLKILGVHESLKKVGKDATEAATGINKISDELTKAAGAGKDPGFEAPAKAAEISKEAMESFEKAATKAYETALKSAEKYAKQVIDWEGRIQFAKLSTEDKIRELGRKGLDEQAQWDDRRLQAEQKLANAKIAMHNKDFRLQERLLSEAESLYASLAVAIIKDKEEISKKEDAGAAKFKRYTEEEIAILRNMGLTQAQIMKSVEAQLKEGTKTQSTEIVQEMNKGKAIAIANITEIGNLRTQMLEAQKQISEGNKEAALQTADAIKTQMDSVKDKNVKVNFDEADLTKMKEQIEDMVKDETKIINIETRQTSSGGDVAGLSGGGKLPGYSRRDTVPAMLTLGERVTNALSTRVWDSTYPGFMALQNTVTSAGQAQALMSKFAANLKGFSAGGLNVPTLKTQSGAPGFAQGGTVSGISDFGKIDLSIGGKSFPVFSDKNVALGLTRAIEKERLLGIN